MSDQCETPMADHVACFWQTIRDNKVRVLVETFHEGCGGHWNSSSFSDDTARAILADHDRLRAEITRLTQETHGLSLPQEVINALAKLPDAETLSKAVTAMRDLERKLRSLGWYNCEFYKAAGDTLEFCALLKSQSEKIPARIWDEAAKQWTDPLQEGVSISDANDMISAAAKTAAKSQSERNSLELALSQLTEAQHALSEAREALKPFAAMAEHLPANYDDEWGIPREVALGIDAGDLRRALRASGQAEPKG